MTMTDDLVKRLRSANDESFVETLCGEAADRIDTLTAQLESTLKDRAQIIAERDRTYALMLARVEKAEADAARLRAALAIDPWHLGRREWKKHARAALNTGKEPSHE